MSMSYTVVFSNFGERYGTMNGGRQQAPHISLQRKLAYTQQGLMLNKCLQVEMEIKTSK